MGLGVVIIPFTITLLINVFYITLSIRNKRFHPLVFSVFIIGLFFAIGIKNTEKPGTGNMAVYGLKCMYIIQDEVYKYRLDNNEFPQDLDFLNEIKLPFNYELTRIDNSIKLTDINESCYINYNNYGEYFQLEYTYGPPGKNKMIYNTIKKEWEIYGYY
jgi:hypothetical protein